MKKLWSSGKVLLIGAALGATTFVDSAAAGKGALSIHGCSATDAAPSAPAVTVLRDEAARDHLRNLAAKRPDAFARSRADLLSRGFLPTRRVVVYRSAVTDLVQTDRASSALRFAQSYQDSNTDGEVTFWSWDDGDDSTWEGSFYVERYSDGAWRMIDVQMDIGTSDYQTVWAVETGSSAPEEEYKDVRTRERGQLRTALLRFGNSDLQFAQTEEERPREEHDVTWDWDRYNSCMMSRCGAACPAACTMMGPAWPECWGACCMSFGVIGCALEELFYW